MTRFNITLEEGVEMVIHAVENSWGGELFVPKIPSVRIADLAEAMAPGVPMIVLETALAAKFNETILDALGVDADRPAGFEDIESLPQKFVVMPADVVQMKTFIATNTGL